MAIRTKPLHPSRPRAGTSGHRTTHRVETGDRNAHRAVGTRTAYPVRVPRTGPILPAPIRLLQVTILATVLAAGTAVCIVLAAVTYLGFLSTTVDVPSAARLAETTFLFDRGGERIAGLHGPVDRTVIPLDAMPLHLRAAVLAAEDKGFYAHGGIDAQAILRAAITDLKQGSFVEGGSTITQQYVKNVFTGGDRTLARKFEEAALAIELERRFSKDQILERYLNTIYFGHGAYGVQAAARAYFGVAARDLKPLQSATLAGLIAGPARFDPVLHPNRAERRRDYVLSEMVDMGAFSEHRATRLAQRPLRLDPASSRSSEAPYFTDVVRRFLFERYGKRGTLRGGLRVETTLDLGWQRAAERAVSSNLSLPGDPSAALVAIDPRTGEIRAMVGGVDFETTKFNLATQAARQTGSAFKPFVLAAALREGISPLSVISGPSSMTIDDPRCETKGEPWQVGNYADASYGTMTIAEGIASSVNTIFAQLALEVGPEDVVTTAHRLGIDAPLSPVCSIALGVMEVTPLDMTSAFATMAANGVRREPTPVTLVRGDEEVLDRPVDVEGTRVLSRNDAATLVWALQGVVDHGTGTAAMLPGRPVAGKTGTSQEYTNAWFCGFVPQLATCVWVGYPEGNIPMEGVHGLSGVTGGSIPASIWHDFMVVATSRMTVLGFPDPDLGEYQLLAPPPPPPPPPAPDEVHGGGDEGHGNGNGHDNGNSHGNSHD
jgi:1A family penicillin-binding protein